VVLVPVQVHVGEGERIFAGLDVGENGGEGKLFTDFGFNLLGKVMTSLN